jgi:mono/diheme cytochrome c family protein
MRTIAITARFAVLAALAALSSGAALAADAKAGEGVYEKSCKSCHGADGTPNAAISKMMKVDMRDLKSPEVQARSDADLKKVVTDGQGKMKPTASVTGASVDNVIAFVRTLKK